MRDVQQRSLQADRVAPRERDAERDVVIERRGALVNISDRWCRAAVVQYKRGQRGALSTYRPVRRRCPVQQIRRSLRALGRHCLRALSMSLFGAASIKWSRLGARISFFGPETRAEQRRAIQRALSSESQITHAHCPLEDVPAAAISASQPPPHGLSTQVPSNVGLRDPATSSSLI
jgi:hypothetical protein